MPLTGDLQGFELLIKVSQSILNYRDLFIKWGKNGVYLILKMGYVLKTNSVIIFIFKQ